jgi:hypothetical protein
MATVKDLMVKIKADTSDFDRGMDEASNSASSFSGKMGKVMDNVKSFLIYGEVIWQLILIQKY